MGGILDNLKPQLDQIGKAGVHALFPNDFEYYAVTLELTDSKGSTIDYLTFPVTPSSIMYDDQRVVNIKKTLGGVTTLDTEIYIPKNISLTGNFGRKLRLLLSPPTVSESSGFDSFIGEGLQIKSSVLNARLKTGYGATKVLEKIIERSSQLDQYNRPNRLYLYVPPLGHNFLVKTNLFKLSQERNASNMMWDYTINFTALAKIEDLGEQGSLESLVKSTALNVVQSGANSVVSSIKNSTF